MEIELLHEKELAKLLKKSSTRDKIAVRQTFLNIEQLGIGVVSTDTIASCKGLKEIIIKCDNEYRIFYFRSGDTIFGLGYCKKSSPQEQNRAITRACDRLQKLKVALKKGES